ncbi:UbiA-domain-containing protein [Cylindrobasidium torrendii FP15055 ss-10]|uniref:4-hydroxybenzoate polyprenyltransferase, mitochondrial n=1 Tax=Cylindrobasidium torrendii FP15055 ss-10 TaxID=1314674 RepID=A0A0D7BNX2_9AGAR|nr:UbiA-domain-containing protein [Cylindrobasidium torrendii FP15055 ss-10]
MPSLAQDEHILPLREPKSEHAFDAVKARPLKFPLDISPTVLHPYMELIRLEKSTGTKLMFWPFVWGLTMAAHAVQSTQPMSLYDYALRLCLCLVWAFVVRSSACTINDIFDRDMDAAVERCKVRPLPSGRISVFAASIYVGIQYLVGVAVFYFTLEGVALYVALFQLLPLFAIYPLLKRVTYWPQAWLGFAMNFGLITAWVSVVGSLDFKIIGCGMLGCWCWTMVYDTIYACQDITDDLKAGVKSTAILFGNRIRPLLIACAVVFVAWLAAAGYLNAQGPVYFVVSVGGTALHLIWQFNTVDLDVPSSCWENFNRNGQLGWIVWLGLVLDWRAATLFCRGAEII